MKRFYLSFVMVSLLCLLFDQTHRTAKAQGPAQWSAIVLTQDWCEPVNEEEVCNQWHTHDLYSTGTSIGEGLPARFKVINLDHKPNFLVEHWNKATESFVSN